MAAVPSVPVLSPGSDSGTKGDRITSVSRPLLTGTADANSTVTVYDGATALGTALADGAGAWSFAPGSSFADGSHSLTATATDGQGTSVKSAALALTIDTVAPATPPQPTLATVSDGGTLGDNKTDVAKPLITGTAEAGSTVTVLDTLGGVTTTLGTTKADSSGKWAFTPTAGLSNVVHSITVRAADAAGNVSATSAALSLGINTNLRNDTPGFPLTVSDFSASGSFLLKNDAIYKNSSILLTSATSTNQVGAAIYNQAFSSSLSVTFNFSYTSGGGQGADGLAFFLLDGDTVAYPNGVVPGEKASSLGYNFATTTGITAGFLGIGFDTYGGYVRNGGAITPNSVGVRGQGSGKTGYTPITYANYAPGINGARDVQVTVVKQDPTHELLTVSLRPTGGGAYTQVISTSIAQTVPDRFYFGFSAGTGGYSDDHAINSLNVTATMPAPPAAPSAPVLDPAADSGAKGDGRTKVVRPKLTGTSDPGNKITVYDSGTALGTATADSSGVWAYTPGTPLADGIHTMTATATDTPGNVSASSASLSLTINTVPPPVPAAPVLDPGSDSGTKGDNLTNVPAPAFDVAAGAGSKITLTDQRISPDRRNGDMYGNGTIEYVLPASYFPSQSPPAASPNIKSLIVSAYSDLASGVGGHFTLTVDGVASGEATANSTTSQDYAFAVDLTPNTGHNIQITFDNDVYTGTGEDRNLYVPSIGIAGRTIYSTDSVATQHPSPSSIDPIPATASYNNGTWIVQPSSPIVARELGHLIRAYATDVDGNVSASSAPVSITFDEAAPAAPGRPSLDPGSDSGTKSDGKTNSAAPLLVGTTEPGAVVTISDGGAALGTATADQNGGWSFARSLIEGSHSITVTATDAAGNTSAASPSFALTIDRTPPAVPSMPAFHPASDDGALGDNRTSASRPIITGTAEPGSIVTVLDGGTALGTTSPAADGTWRFIPPAPLANGPHTITATTTDDAGNTSAASPALAATIDTTSQGTNPSFPLNVSDFSASTAFTLKGDAGVNGSALRLTSAVNNQAGLAIYNNAFSSSLGLTFNFTYFSGGGSGADGLAFFLLDGNTVSNPSGVVPGAYGGGLGYSNSGQDGITGGFIGIGFDTYGSYAGADRGQQASGISGSTADYIGVRGQGFGRDGYDWITGVQYAPGINGARDVQVNVLKQDATHERLQVFIKPASDTAYVRVINATINQALPSNLYFGFSAGTGGLNDVHEIRTASVNTPVDLVFGPATVTDTTAGTTNPPTIAPGHRFSYTYTLTNNGPNDDAEIVVTDALPANVAGVSWTVSDSAGSHAGTGAAIPVSLIKGAAATITVSATIDANATSGNADHVVSVSPGARFSAENPNASETLIQIGHGDPSVSLVGANAASATGDNAASAPFATASVVDTYRDPSTPDGNPADTLTVAINPAAGTLSATGAAYDSATGKLTATGTPAQLQSILRAVRFVPAENTAPPGTTTPVSITATVTDTSSGNTTGPGGPPTAAQSAAVAVTSIQDSPALGGAQANQPVADNATASPFAAFTVTDPDRTGATILVTFPGAATNGDFTAASASGWTRSTAGDGSARYSRTLAEQPNIGAAVQAALRALVFRPATRTSLTGASATVPFSITVTDTAPTPASATDGNTSLFVSDATPPAAPSAPVLDPGSDSGAAGDNRTNVTRPLLTGAAEAGSTVTVSDGNTILGTAPVDSGSRWQFVPASPLADGSHTFTARDTDAAGNVSPASGPLTLTINSAPPPAPAAPTLDPGSDSGAKGDGTTSEAVPVVLVTAGAGVVVSLSDQSGPIATTASYAAGVWALRPTSPLAEGSHLVRAVVTDADGNASPASPPFALTIDRTPPAAPSAPELDPVSDSGASGDGVTNVTVPVLAGAAEAGSVVTVYDGGAALGSTTAAPDGRWSFTSPALADGPHGITATAADKAGNASPASSALALTIDTAAPAPPSAPALAPGSDGGTKGDGMTNVAAPVFVGTAEAGSAVAVFDAGARLGGTTAGSDGQWSFASPGLTDGSHTVTAIATDAAGNTSPNSPALALTIDTAAPPAPSPPALSSDSDTGTKGDGITAARRPVLVGAAEAGSTVAVFDGPAQLGVATADGSGAWSLALAADLAEGIHAVSARATDVAGNVSQPSPAFSLTIDATAPASPSTPALDQASDSGDQGDGLTNVVRPTLVGAAEAGSTITVIDTDGSGQTTLGTTITDGAGRWSFASPTLTDGTHTVTAVATDDAGNTSPTSPALALTIDTAAPVPPDAPRITPASDTGTKGDGITADPRPALAGTAEAGSVVTVRDGSVPVGTATADGAGAWSLALAADLADGLHNLTATATDAAGNTSPSSPALALLIDTAAPAAPAGLALDPGSDSGAKGDGVTNVAAPVLVGAAEPGSTVTLFDGGAGLGSAVANGAGQWSFTSPGLIDGAHSLSATATDAAGNVSGASAAFVLTIDTAAPSSPSSPRLTSDSDSGAKGDGVTAIARPVLAGTAEAGSTVTVFDGNAQVGTTVADNAGAWSLALAADLAEGVHQLTAAAIDAAGNASSSSAAFSLIIDATAPAAPSMPVLDPGSDSGTEGDGVTAIVTPTLTGTAEAGSLVTLIDAAGGATLGTATADGAGRWLFTSSALPDGAHDIAAFATDAAGNVSPTSPALALIIDTAAPAAPDGLALDPASDSGIGGDGLTNVAAPVLIGTGEAGSMIAVFGDGARLGDATAGPDGRWSFTSPVLTDGLRTITATATDVAGNVSNASSALEITIDTAAPSPPSPPALSSDSDTGTKGDGITAARRPVLVGAAEAGSTVAVFDGPAQLGVATADGSGAWSLALAADLAEGIHAVSVTATDAAGNVSAASSVFSLAIDTTAPVPPPAPALDGASDSGTEGDGVTSAFRPAFVGTAEAGSAVTLIDDTGTGRTTLGTTVADGTGRWSFDSPMLADGPHTITAISADTAGNASAASPPLALSIDTAAPAAPSGLALDPASDSGVKGDGLTNIANPMITGTAEPGSTVTVLDGDPGVQLGTVQADSAGRWSFGSPALSEGGHSITATATDAAGNASPASSPFLLTIDGTQLRITATLLRDSGASAVDGTTSDPTLIGTSEAGSVITLSEDGDNLGTATVDSAGRWAILPLGIGDGAHTITASGVDAAGNAGTAQVSFVLDATAPAAPTGLALAPASDTGVRGDGITNAVRPVVTGVAEPGSVVALFDAGNQVGAVAAGADGAWSIAADLMNDGDHDLAATATDAAGNVSPTSALFNLTIDTAAPASSSIPTLDAASDTGAQGDGITALARPTIVGTAEPGSMVTLTDESDAGRSMLGNAVADGAGIWSFTSPALADGLHTITVVVADAAGNASPSSSPLSLLIDTAAPPSPEELALDPAGDSGVQGDSRTNVVRPTIIGTAEAGSSVAVRDGDAFTLIGTARADDGGRWSFASPALAEGQHSIIAIATDAAGNISPASIPLNFIIDVTAPFVTAALSRDTGVSAADVLTSDPTLTGIGEAGSSVTLTEDGRVVGIGAVNGAGRWTIAPAGITEGTHTLTASDEDAAGNVGTAQVSFALDTTAPAAPTGLALASVSDSGVQGDGMTSASRPIIVGTADAGSVVAVFEGGDQIGSAIAAGDGAWAVNAGQLADGIHQFTATATDDAGNASIASAPLSLTIDTAAPAAPSAPRLTAASDTGSRGDGVTSLTRPVLTGTAEPGTLVSLADADQDGVLTGLGAVQAGADGVWVLTCPRLSEGAHTLTATATDAAGNVSATSLAFTLLIDTVPPALTAGLAEDTGVSPADGLTANPALAGSGEVGTLVTIRENGILIGQGAVDPEGRWSFVPVGLAEGPHVLAVSDTDTAGNASEIDVAMTLDTTPPPAPGGLTLTPASYSNPANRGVTSVSRPTVVGTAEPGASIIVRDGNSLAGTTVADASGAWSLLTGPLADGGHAFSATAADAAGNRSDTSALLSFTIDTQAPSAPSVVGIAPESDSGLVGDGVTSVPNPQMVGTAETGSLVMVTDLGGVPLGSATADRDGRWSIVSPVLAEGAHTVTATATDAVGNTSQPSAAFALTIDMQAPASPSVPVLAPESDSGPKGDGITNEARPILSGFAEAGSVVTILDRTGGGAAVLGTARADQLGSWSFVSPALSDGTHAIVATATDSAGNVSSLSEPLSLVIDTAVPASPEAPTLDPASDSGSRGDGITNVTRPTLSGTGRPGQAIRLLDTHDGGVTELGAAAVDAAGRWTITPESPLVAGSHAIAAAAINAAGTVSAASSPFVLVIHPGPIVAPSIVGISPATDSGALGDGVTNAMRPVLTGRGTPGSLVALAGDGSAMLGTASVADDGGWSIEAATLRDGAYRLVATATDDAGNVSRPSAAFDLLIDTAPPAVTAELAGSPGNPAFAGTTEPGLVVTLTDAGAPLGSTEADGAGRWTFTPSSLADGGHDVVALAADVAGNVGSARLRFVTAPQPQISTDYTVIDGAGLPEDGVLVPYVGSVAGIERQYIYKGAESAVIVARAPNALLRGGAGTDAIVAQNGRNILDGAGGSSWLIGGTGQNSFIVDARGQTWSTVIGFRPGDDVTIRGLEDGRATFAWDGIDGQDGYRGATLRGLNLDTGEGFAVTLAGLSVEQAKRYAATGQTGADGTRELRLIAPNPSQPSLATYAVTDVATGLTATESLDIYQGPVEGLRYEHIEAGDASVILVAQASDAFLRSGSGTDALVARNGDNVLDGGAGSNWLVGGAGRDTFFVDARGGAPVWDTVLNFHAGDAVTIWGYQAGTSSWQWTPTVEGADGYKGATLRGLAGGQDVAFSVTLAGVAPDRARGWSVTSGISSDNQGYLRIQA